MNSDNNTLAIISPQKIARARRLYAEAENAAKRAVFNVAGAVRIAHECGTALRSIRAEYPETRGRPPADGKTLAHATSIPWVDFVERQMGFSYETAQRYMRLAQVPLDRLCDVESIRQAYLLAGVLPAREDKGRGPGRRYDPMGQLARLADFLNDRISAEPPDRWDDRDALKERLRPLVDLYAKLSGNWPC